MTDLNKQVADGFNALDAKLSEQVVALEKRMDASIRDLSQQMTGYKGHSGGNLEGKGGSLEGVLAKSMGEQLSTFRDMGSRGQINMKLPASELLGKAAAGTLTTGSTPVSYQAGAGMPAGVWPFGLHHAFSVLGTGDINSGHSTINYLRYSAAGGNGAAAEAAEGTAKAQYDLKWNQITVDPWVVAGYAKVSNQELASFPTVAQAIRSAGVVQINRALDGILYSGSASGNKFEGVSKLATAFTSTFSLIPDAIEDVQFKFLDVGLQADTVVLNYATYLAVKSQLSTINTYLTGNYIDGSLATTIRGMRVVISPSVPAGKALVMDSSQYQLGIAQDVLTEVGYVNDDFTKNLCTIRTESKYIAQVFRDDAAYLVSVTPKA